MSEHHKHAEFLKHCLRYDDSSKRQEMMEKLTRIQRELRVVRRASFLIGVLIAFAIVSLVYPAILVQNFPYNLRPSTMNFIFALIAGMLISLFAFAGLWLVLRKKLHRQCEECRRNLVQVLSVRLDSEPHK
ncbi:MAG: hypothetical protein ABSE48_10105 [Verrucomicrobiota bacterium]